MVMVVRSGVHEGTPWRQERQCRSPSRIMVLYPSIWQQTLVHACPEADSRRRKRLVSRG